MSDKKAELEFQLKQAINELESWQDYDLRRTDGSQAQDTRHENRGKSLQQKVSSIQHEISKLG